MKISQLYQQLEIPSSLQHHMLTTAAVGKFISDRWQSPPKFHQR
jgi:hypothetical protein